MSGGRAIDSVRVVGPVSPLWAERVLTPEALAFVGDLHEHFAGRRRDILAARAARAGRLAQGEVPQFLPETRSVREGAWQVGAAPRDLEDRRIEMTGPAEPKMLINGLNSGARAFMADLEDALSPTWPNVIGAQVALQDAVRKTLSFRSPEGKEYKLNPEPATLLVRPRGWHLPERHMRIGGDAASGTLVDFGLFFFHNAREALARGSGAYFYLPKLEGHLEARLWHDVFTFAESTLGIAKSSTKCTVLIETILAAFEMDEILYELRPYITGLNAGRWDYIFSIIKKFSHAGDALLPDRAQVTMTVPFMQAYSELLVKTCHRRGAHAMGGMSAFVPSRKDPEVNRVAFAKVLEDKEREVAQGFDGTWVAHPDLVGVVAPVFDRVFGKRSHQKARQRDDVVASAAALLALTVPSGKITEAGVRSNIEVGLLYIDHWLQGTAAVAIHNLMEDAATAEIARAQLWQWLRHGAKLADGRILTPTLYEAWRDEELARLGGSSRFEAATEVLNRLVLAAEFPDFLTLSAYERLPM